MKSSREILTQRYADKTISREELETLINLLTEDGLNENNEMLREVESYMRSLKTIPEEVNDHVANDLFYEREENEKATVPMYRSGKFVWWSAAATIVFALSVGLYTQLFNVSNSLVASNEIAPDILITVKGPEFVIMPDSSTAILNAGSELSYRKSFGQELREVFLTGEAFFDIKHDPSHKFVVHSGNITTTVLGTAFNVKELPSQVVVTVTRGKVSVKDEVQEFGTITPNEQFIVNTDSRLCTRTKVADGNATGWTNHFIILNNETFDRAVEVIEARFNVKVVVENQALLKCRVTSAFLEEPTLEDVLTVISTVAKASWTMKDGSVTIQGGGCN